MTRDADIARIAALPWNPTLEEPNEAARVHVEEFRTAVLALLADSPSVEPRETTERCLAHLQDEPCPTCAAYIAAGL